MLEEKLVFRDLIEILARVWINPKLRGKKQTIIELAHLISLKVFGLNQEHKVIDLVKHIVKKVKSLECKETADHWKETIYDKRKLKDDK